MNKLASEVMLLAKIQLYNYDGNIKTCRSSHSGSVSFYCYMIFFVPTIIFLIFLWSFLKYYLLLPQRLQNKNKINKPQYERKSDNEEFKSARLCRFENHRVF